MTQNRKILIASVLGMATAALLAGYWISHDEDTAPSTSFTTDAASGRLSAPDNSSGNISGGGADQAQTTRATSFNTGLENLPASLRDVNVDGALAVDVQGHLILDFNVRRVFDFFLTATGEEPLEILVSRIRAYINSQLPPDAATEAHRVLDEYLAMQQALEGVSDQTTPIANDGEVDAATLRARKADIQAVRQQYLHPDTYSAFYDQEDQYDNFSLSRLEIVQDKTLSPLERSEKVAALEQTLPDELRESVQALSRLQNLNTLTREWQTSGGSDAELRQMRENLLGPEATDRLEALDNQREEWDQRVSRWTSERNEVLANAALSEQDKAEQLDALRQNHFSASELNRVKALERISDGADH